MTLIVVIEPNPLLRLGILHLLSKLSTDPNLAGYDYRQLAQHTADQPCDLAVLSVSGDKEITRLVNNVEQTCSPKAILVLYDSAESPASIHAASPLVAGCVYKHAAPEVIQAAAQLVLAGGNCFPSNSKNTGQAQLFSLYEPEKWSLPCVNAGAMPFSAQVARPVDNESKMLGLTPRQYEVLVLLARGYPMKTVGRQLNISVATAKAHTESLYQRLDVRNRNAAVYTAIARGATLGWTSITSHQSTTDQH